MTAQTIILSYLYKQFQDDPDLQAFVDSFNSMTQGYLDYLNALNLPIYTGLSGALLDWVGAGLYGYPRPSIGVASGSIFGSASIFNEVVFGSGRISSTIASDDIYKRILTWKLFRGDGFIFNVEWLKRRLKRFLIGANGSSPAIDNTAEISVNIANGTIIEININYPTDPASKTLLTECLLNGILDVPFQYQLQVS